MISKLKSPNRLGNDHPAPMRDPLYSKMRLGSITSQHIGDMKLDRFPFSLAWNNNGTTMTIQVTVPVP